MHAINSLLVAGFLAAASSAQDVITFPMSPYGVDAPTGVARLLPSHEGIAALVGRDEILLTAAPLPDGTEVDLELTRIRHEQIEFGYRVDGSPAPDLLDGADLSIWKGVIAGTPGSEVVLSFSHHGSRGWLHTGEELVHLMPQPDDNGDWMLGYSLLTTEAELASLGWVADLSCQADELVDLDRSSLDGIPGHDGAPVTVGGGGSLYGCDLAIETDWQLNQVFGGSLAAETAYVTTLLSLVSDRYVEQVSTVLSFPYVQFYTTPADPWSSPDGGGSSIDMLNEFVNAWSGSIPGGADIGHFLSGANLGGGVAYLSVLCDTSHSFSFAVSGNIDGNTPFPISVSPLNWDFMVTAHETGHNFGSPHTHDYSPPIDNCAGGACITNGTIMSYCHLCPGGLINITTYFHPAVVSTINSHVAGCLDIVVGITALPPTTVSPGVPTTLTANIEGTPTGSVDMNYRFDSASAFTAVAMTAVGGGDYTADLPAPSCGDMPEFYFSFTDTSAGPFSSPVYSAEVGNLTVIFSDDFQTSQGWTVGVPSDDATTGIWTRADPLGTGAQPGEGVDTGTGDFCYFTGQGSPGGSLGEQDIDDGKTTLISPVIDLSSGDARIGYYRWYSNNTGATPGADIFEVEITNNGLSWVDVETVGPTGAETQGGWYYHEFDVSSVVTPTASVQLRFIASDEGSGSVVEAALDEFQVFRVDCETCQTDLGYGGPGSATLSLCGSDLVPGATADLEIDGGPASSATFIGYSASFNPTPLLGGTLCPIPVIDVVSTTTDGAGQALLPIMGGAGAPTTVYLQAVILDSGSGQFLFTNCIGADFLP